MRGQQHPEVTELTDRLNRDDEGGVDGEQHERGGNDQAADSATHGEGDDVQFAEVQLA